MVHIIIVEDDPMVAQINQQYLQRMGDFKIDGIFSNGLEALNHLRGHPAELAILDVYMPIVSGIELLRQIRGENINTAVIMVTAATEMRTVDEALRLGIVDYLIKPFSFSRFREAIEKYLGKVNLLKSSDTVDQAAVDRLLKGNWTLSAQNSLHKGLNQKTLDSIQSYLREHPTEKHTCESLSAASGLSKVTIRHYLNYLIETGQLLSSIDYETGGRPRVLYHLK